MEANWLPVLLRRPSSSKLLEPTRWSVSLETSNVCLPPFSIILLWETQTQVRLQSEDSNSNMQSQSLCTLPSRIKLWVIFCSWSINQHEKKIKNGRMGVSQIWIQGLLWGSDFCELKFQALLSWEVESFTHTHLSWYVWKSKSKEVCVYVIFV